MTAEECRQLFEKWHREKHPHTNVTRKGDGYTKQSVNNRWEVWQDACAAVCTHR